MSKMEPCVQEGSNILEGKLKCPLSLPAESTTEQKEIYDKQL